MTTLPFLRENLGRVRGAAAYASREGAKIVSLGGFSSILIEGNIDRLSEHAGTVFTTGNSLTVAFIVQGVERMCALEGRDLRSATLLVVGATGDVGSGVARCLSQRVKRVLLHARNPERLQMLAAELSFNRSHGGRCTRPAASARLRGPRDLRGKSLLSVAAAGWYCSWIDRLRCGLSQEPVAGCPRSHRILRRTWASRGGFNQSTRCPSCSLPSSSSRCAPRMSVGRDNPRIGGEI